MIRADAWATLHLFHPFYRRAARTRRVPILMYHSIAADRPETTHPYYRTVTSPHVFAQHMKFLRENGYTSVRPGRVEPFLNGQSPSHAENAPAKPVVITFDDGFSDFYTNAYPILKEYGLTATMYLPTAFIGTEPRNFNGMECMSWDQIRELDRAGIEFGSHTVTHPHLERETREDVQREVRTSKDTIEQELGHAIESFAYPYAFPEADRAFTGSLRSFLEEAGYDNGVCTVIGTAGKKSDRYFMKRLPANSCDDLPLFEAKLNGAYDWLHTVQYMSKLVSRG